MYCGDRVSVHSCDESDEWAYCTTASSSTTTTSTSDSNAGKWIPRSILQHTPYTARVSYRPVDSGEVAAASNSNASSSGGSGSNNGIISVSAGDLLFSYYRDESGWTYGEKL